MKVLTNRYVDCKLINLDEHDDPAGPFVVTQLAHDPEDQSYTEALFFLRRDGQWIDEVAQQTLPDEERFSIFYGSTAEAVERLRSLVGPVAVVRLPVTKEDVRERIATIESGAFKSRVAATVARYRASRRP